MQEKVETLYNQWRIRKLREGEVYTWESKGICPPEADKFVKIAVVKLLVNLVKNDVH